MVDVVNDDDDEGARAASRFLENLANGAVHEQFSDELARLGRELAHAVETRDVAAKGEVTLKLKFKLERNGLCAITGEVTRKSPKQEPAPGVAWITDGGNFVGSNPRQQVLPGVRVVKQRADVREVGEAPRAPRSV